LVTAATIVALAIVVAIVPIVVFVALAVVVVIIVAAAVFVVVDVDVDIVGLLLLLLLKRTDVLFDSFCTFEQIYRRQQRCVVCLYLNQLQRENCSKLSN